MLAGTHVELALSPCAGGQCSVQQQLELDLDIIQSIIDY